MHTLLLYLQFNKCRLPALRKVATCSSLTQHAWAAFITLSSSLFHDCTVSHLTYISGSYSILLSSVARVPLVLHSTWTFPFVLWQSIVNATRKTSTTDSAHAPLLDLDLIDAAQATISASLLYQKKENCDERGVSESRQQQQCNLKQQNKQAELNNLNSMGTASA